MVPSDQNLICMGIVLRGMLTLYVLMFSTCFVSYDILQMYLADYRIIT